MTASVSPPPLFPHQQELLDRTWELPAWAVFFQTGCVDCETEYLSPRGWRRIDQYQGGEVAQWWPNTEQADFVMPSRYVNEPCDEMIRISGKYGTDQLLSLDHRVPLFSDYHGGYWKTIEARELADADLRQLPNRATMSIRGPGIALSDADLRLQIAVMADGHFLRQTSRCTIRLKRPRKIERLRELLTLAGRDAAEKDQPSTGFTIFHFDAPLRAKTYPSDWWELVSEAQANVIADEVFYWDGTIKGDRKLYRSNHEGDVDFIQFILMSRGLVTRRSLFAERTGSDGRKRSETWEVSTRGVNDGAFWVKRKNLSRERPADGRMYCFTVPSGYLLLRRRGVPFPTGNCGKTAPTIHTAARLFEAGRIDAAVVVAPNMVHRNWITDEIPKHSPIRWRGLDWHSSRAKAQDRALAHLLETPPRVLPWLAITYDGLITPRGRKAAIDFLTRFSKIEASVVSRGEKAVLDFLARSPRVMLVIDEGSRVKNPEAQRTKKVAALRKLSAYVRLLNGTPTTQAPTEIYAQMRLLDDAYWLRHGIASFVAFKSRFCIFKKIVVGGEDDREDRKEVYGVAGGKKTRQPFVVHDADPDGVAAYEQLDFETMLGSEKTPVVAGATDAPIRASVAPATTGRTIEIVVGYRELDKLHAMIQPLSTRLTKEQAGLNLPPKLYQRLVFDLDPEQRRIYDQLRKEYMVELENGVLITAAMAMVRITRLHQVACGYLPNPEDPDGEPILVTKGPNPRLAAYMDWLEDVGRQQMIVWCRFTRDVDLITRELGPARCVRFDGKVTEKEKTKALDLFTSGKRQVCVAKAASMGMGLTLVNSSISFYYSNTFSLLERLQSEDRQHRPGQHNPVTYVDLTADKTVDGLILKSFRENNEMARQVVGDEYREWLAA